MHPYRENPVEPVLDVEEAGTRTAFLVLAIAGIVEMFASPIAPAGAFGAACSVLSVAWLARHPC